jgi:hypothetical protein
MKGEMAGKQEKLVGKYFHSANETNKIEWQGVVIGEPRPGWYLVQLFEWSSGELDVQRLVPIEKMIGWLFYPDAAAMTFGSKRSEHQSTEVSQAQEKTGLDQNSLS